MNKCKKCGQPLIEGAKFCTSCGTLNDGTDFGIDTDQTVVGQTLKKGLNKWIVIGSACALGAVVLFGVMSFLGDDALNISDKQPKTAKVKKKASEKEIKKQKEKAIKTESPKIYAYKNGEGYGILDSKLTVINENVSASPVEFNKHGVGVAYQNGKAGLIDIKGEAVSEMTDSNMGHFGVMHGNGYPVVSYQSKSGVLDIQVLESDSSLMGLMNTKGDIVFEPGEVFISPFMGRTMTEYYKTNGSGGQGVLSETGEVVVEPVNNWVTIISEKLIGIQKNESDSFMIVDMEGNVLEETSYNDISSFYDLPGYFVVTNALGKKGIMNDKLEEVLPPKWTYISSSVSSDGKYFVFRDNDKDGLATLSGDVVIDAKYDSLSSPNKEGVLTFKKGEHQGIMTIEEDVIKDDFKENFYAIADTNLFEEQLFGDEMYTKVYNSQGEEVLNASIAIPALSRYRGNTYILPRDNDGKEMWILYEDGTTLSEEAVFYQFVDNTLLIQEENKVMLVNLDTGKVIKEKDLKDL